MKTKIITVALLFSFAACNHKAEEKKPTPAPAHVYKEVGNEEDGAIVADTYRVKVLTYDDSTKKGMFVIYKTADASKKSKADFEVKTSENKVVITNVGNADGATEGCTGFDAHEAPIAGKSRC